MSSGRPPAVPQQVRLATGLLLGLAAVLLLTGVLVFAVRARIANSVATAAATAPGHSATDPGALAASLVVVAGVFLLVGVLAAVAGVLARQRRPWARWLGVAVGVLLGVLGIQFLLSGAGSLVALLIPAGAIGVAVTVVSMLLSSPAAAWFRATAP